MNIDIRKSIISNFQNSKEEEINTSIEEAIQDKDEVTLPGLGVFFELLWENSSNQERKNIIDKLKKNLS